MLPSGAEGLTPRFSRLRAVAAAFALWTGLGLFFSSQFYVLGTPPLTWLQSMQLGMPRWYSWGLCAPGVIASDRWLLSGRSLRTRLLWHVPLGLLWTGIAIALRLVGRPLLGNPWPPSLVAFVLQRVYWDLLIYGVIAGVAVARDFASRAREQERRTHALQIEALGLQQMLTEARLQSLRSQLHPHFLFNALNTISALTESEPRTARRLMEQLGRLLRVSLRHAATPLVTLAEELTFLDDYLAIETVRFEGRISIAVHAEDGALEALVPGFMLQPLVENAIRHGVAPRAAGGHVRVAAARRGDRLHLSVRDDGVGLPSGWDLRNADGVGLRNTASRLAQLYPDAHTFRVAPAESGSGVTVTVDLPFQPAGLAAPRPDGQTEEVGV